MSDLESLIAEARTALLTESPSDPCDRSLLDYYRQRFIDEGERLMKIRREVVEEKETV